MSVRCPTRVTEQAHEGRVTSGSAPQVPPASWGLGDTGRPAGVVDVRGEQGRGAPRLMKVRASNIDGVLLIVGLLLWTAIMLVFFAPTH